MILRPRREIAPVSINADLLARIRRAPSAPLPGATDAGHRGMVQLCGRELVAWATGTNFSFFGVFGMRHGLLVAKDVHGALLHWFGVEPCRHRGGTIRDAKMIAHILVACKFLAASGR